MRYQTGDVAEFMGMTNMGVIYLEKRGIIQAQREANGYRSFGLETVTRLGIIRSYERLGFSLEEAAVLAGLPAEAVAQRLEEKKAELLQQLDILSFLQGEVEHPLVGEGPLSPENAQLCIMPELYYCPVWEDLYDMDALSADTRRLLRRIDVSWISAMPYMRYCDKMRFDGREWRKERGNCILAQHAREMGVLLPETWVEHIPARRCLCYYSATGDAAALLQKGQVYLESLGLRWESVAFVPLFIHYQLADPTGYTACVYLPVGESG